MDATGRLNNNRGSALVFIAVGLVVLIALTALAIDLGYMYVAKGQLQSAADSAALAGAAKLDGSKFVAQSSARNTAFNFAKKNKAAGDNVLISYEKYSNYYDLNQANDITVGNWGGNPKTYTRATGSPSTSQINAVEVRTRRTGTGNEVEGKSLGASSGGPIPLFLSKVFKIPRMGASATAIAAKVASAGFYLFIGQSVCSWTGPGTIDLSANLEGTTDGNMAWTSFFDNSTNTGAVLEYLCLDDPINYEVCGKSIYTTGGTVTPDYRAVKVDFYDPAYDTANKTFDNSGKVTSWTVIVPVSEVNDPTKQPTPALVWGYAKIRIVEVCAPGGPGSNPCNGRPDPPGSACNDSYQRIIIDHIECVDCPSSGSMFGTKLRLVQ